MPKPTTQTDIQAKIAALLGGSDDVPEVELGPPNPALAMPEVGRNAGGAAGLSGFHRLVMAFGAGNTGKTTLIRWIVDRAVARGEGGTLLFSLDAGRQTLRRFYPETVIVPSLEKLLSKLVRQPSTAVIDFPADTTLVKVGEQVPGLIDVLREASIDPVALFTLSPRQEDLNLLRDMRHAKLCPPATALVMNLGRGDLDDFTQVRRHSVVEAALADGVVEVLMPRLWAAGSVEARGISYTKAANGAGLNMFDIHRVLKWQQAMDLAFAPVIGWLP